MHGIRLNANDVSVHVMQHFVFGRHDTKQINLKYSYKLTYVLVNDKSLLFNLQLAVTHPKETHDLIYRQLCGYQVNN